MKKLIASAIFVTLLGCQSQNINETLTPIENTPVKISSKVGVIKSEHNSIFPSEVGYTWNYDVVYHPTDDPYEDLNGTYTLSVEKSRKNGTQTVINLRAIDTVNTEYFFPTLTITKNNISVSGVTYLGFGADKAEDLKTDFLHLPIKEGEKWDDGLWLGETKKLEKVTIPSGTFDAWKINVIGTYNNAYTAVGNFWITPGIGIIKSELAVPGWTFESVLTSASKK